MTERLYYADSYTLDFEARIVERLRFKDRPAVILDRSYFYPEGGGQPCDTGLLNGIAVVDVQTREPDRAVIHVLASELPSGDQVHGQIDAARRQDLRIHHSGQHILSQALSRAAQAETISVHMSLDSMTIDVGRAALTPSELEAVEALANQIVWADLPVRAWFPSESELANLPLRKVPDVAGALRVIDIGSFDITACGGTHVARTGEIGLIKLIRQDKKGNSTRFEFKCGLRAFADYQIKHAVLNQLSATLSANVIDLPDGVARLREDIRALQAELKPLRERAIELEVDHLLAEAGNGRNARLIMRVFPNRDADSLKALAQRIVARPGAIACLGSGGERAQIIVARSEDVSLDSVTLLKAALTTLGIQRGGGRPNFAQGGGVAATDDQVLAALQLAIGQIDF